MYLLKIKEICFLYMHILQLNVNTIMICFLFWKIKQILPTNYYFHIFLSMILSCFALLVQCC